MVKLSTASIRLVQKKNRMNKVGEYPIYIVVCFGGRVEKVVLYTARHSFASAYLNSEGATVRGAASLLSRSANTISVYIHALQNDRDIADAVSFLDD